MKRQQQALKVIKESEILLSTPTCWDCFTLIFKKNDNNVSNIESPKLNIWMF